uniref:Uncharacterized protein n=1 Tax=Oryza barthii TaxID=65489 RepID=A0A0D3GZB8_9ORYZ
MERGESGGMKTTDILFMISNAFSLESFVCAFSSGAVREAASVAVVEEGSTAVGLVDHSAFSSAASVAASKAFTAALAAGARANGYESASEE